MGGADSRAAVRARCRRDSRAVGERAGAGVRARQAGDVTAQGAGRFRGRHAATAQLLHGWGTQRSSRGGTPPTSMARWLCEAVESAFNLTVSETHVPMDAQVAAVVHPLIQVTQLEVQEDCEPPIPWYRRQNFRDAHQKTSRDNDRHTTPRFDLERAGFQQRHGSTAPNGFPKTTFRARKNPQTRRVAREQTPKDYRFATRSGRPQKYQTSRRHRPHIVAPHPEATASLARVAAARLVVTTRSHRDDEWFQRRLRMSWAPPETPQLPFSRGFTH